MLLHKFSQEGEVAREIEILFMRIFGLLVFMQTISRQLKVTDLEKSDTSWPGAIEQNMKYNSASLGANIWDLVCKWNQDIRTVEFWLKNYVNENETRVKYFVEPLKEWEKKLTDLDIIRKIFDNSGAVDESCIFLQLERKKNVNINDANLKFINEGEEKSKKLTREIEKQEKLCVKYLSKIHENNVEITDCTQKNIFLTNEKNDLEKKCAANQIKIDETAVSEAIKVNEIAVLKKNIASGIEKNLNTSQELAKSQKDKSGIEELLKRANNEIKNTIQELAKSQKDKSVIQKSLTRANNEQKNSVQELNVIKLKLIELKKENIVSEKSIYKQTEELDSLKNIQGLLKEKTFQYEELQKEIIVSQESIEKINKELKKLQLENERPQSDQSEEFKNAQTRSNDLEKEVTVCEKEIESLQQKLMTSQQRNTSQQKIIDKQRIDLSEAASDKNYNELKKDRDLLTEKVENQSTQMKHTEEILANMWSQLKKAQGKGCTILSPSQMKKKQKEDEEQEEERIKKTKRENTAKGGWSWTRAGPSSYII